MDDVDCVINYEVPEENEYYIHRIGRTGRAKRKGKAYSIIGNFPEKAKLDEIGKYSNFTIRPMLLGRTDPHGGSGEGPCDPEAFPVNPREAGFLLLGSRLGDPVRHPLTGPQLQRLAKRVRLSPMPGHGGEELTESHLRLWAAPNRRRLTWWRFWGGGPAGSLSPPG